MNINELREQIAIELEALELTVEELLTLQRDLAGKEATVREKTAAAAFLAQFYTGIENILKRISQYNGVPLPTGDTWHIELFKRFCTPSHPQLPILFDPSLASMFSSYRRFRHVVFHGYGFQIDWSRMEEGISNITPVFVCAQ